jgi:hypothetical protein
MVMRHFGHGVRHLQYHGQQEIGPDAAVDGNNNDNAAVFEEMDKDMADGTQGGAAADLNDEPEFVGSEGNSDLDSLCDSNDDTDSNDCGYASP